MPEMDLGVDVWYVGINDDPLEFYDDFAVDQGWQKVLCYMIWPLDDSRRAAELAVFYGKAIEVIEKLKVHSDGEILAREIFRDLANDTFERVGGWSALSPMLDGTGGGERRNSQEHLCIAGQTLAIISAIDETYPDIKGRASLNKAIDLMDRTGLSTRTKTYACWKTHKSVDHLQIAYNSVQHLKIIDSFTELQTFLSIARNFQKFAMRFVDPAVIWAVPAALDLPVCEPVRHILDDKMIEALRSYRARQ